MPLRLCRRAMPVLVALAAGCDRSAPSDEGAGSRVTVATADAIAVLAHEAYSGYRSEVRMVVSDPLAWSATWQQVYALAEPEPDLPAVDFATDAVLVVALGERSAGGFDIVIDSVVTLEAGTEVHVTTVTAGPSCARTAALTQPVQVVRVAAPRAPVRFVERVAVEECD